MPAESADYSSEEPHVDNYSDIVDGEESADVWGPDDLLNNDKWSPLRSIPLAVVLSLMSSSAFIPPLPISNHQLSPPGQCTVSSQRLAAAAQQARYHFLSTIDQNCHMLMNLF